VLDPIGQGYVFQPGTFKNQSTSVVRGIVQTRDGYFYSKGVKDEPHSVIAKMNFGATGGGTTGTNAAQWFATGKAAEELAKNPATPAAMAGDAQLMSTKVMHMPKNNSNNTYTILKLTFKEFEKYLENEGKSDKEAKQIKSEIDNIDTGDFRKVFNLYYFDKGKLVDNKNYPDLSDNDHKKASFSNVINYLQVLETSINNANKACDIPEGVELKKLSDDKAIDKDYIKALKLFDKENSERKDRLLTVMAKNEYINKYMSLYVDKILYGDASK